MITIKVQATLAALLLVVGFFLIFIGSRSGVTIAYLAALGAFAGSIANALGARQSWRRGKLTLPLAHEIRGKK